MAKVKITQTKSVIEKTERQKNTIKSLGLKNIHDSVEKELTPQIAGMLKKVSHLVSVTHL